jgi:hypothetical protein
MLHPGVEERHERKTWGPWTLARPAFAHADGLAIHPNGPFNARNECNERPPEERVGHVALLANLTRSQHVAANPMWLKKAKA